MSMSQDGPRTRRITSTWATWRACVATVLCTVASVSCDTPRTYTAPTPPVTSPPPPLRITAFAVSESVEGATYVYAPTLTLTAGADAVTVTELWIELEDHSNGWASHLRDPRLPYRIPAGATHRLFENPPAYFAGEDFRADWVWAIVTYVDDSGRSARIHTSSMTPSRGVGR
jgi:hypothetical protein